jgi:hypothetical protein
MISIIYTSIGTRFQSPRGLVPRSFVLIGIALLVSGCRFQPPRGLVPKGLIHGIFCPFRLVSCP